MKIILFTGLSASGKSVISKKVSEKLGLPRINLHAIIHEIAAQKGFPRARNWISAVGVEQSLEETRSRLANLIEEMRNRKGVIVDEVVDPATLAFLESQFREDEFCSVYIRANRHDRKRFMDKRLGGKDRREAQREIHFIDHLKEEVGIAQIIENVDYRFENFRNVESVANNIANTLRREVLGTADEFSVKGERGF